MVNFCDTRVQNSSDSSVIYYALYCYYLFHCAMEYKDVFSHLGVSVYIRIGFSEGSHICPQSQVTTVSTSKDQLSKICIGVGVCSICLSVPDLAHKVISPGSIHVVTHGRIFFLFTAVNILPSIYITFL